MSSRRKQGTSTPTRAALHMHTHCPSTVQTKCSLLWLNGASLLVPSLPLPPVAIYSCRASAAKSLACFVASIESFILKLAMPTDSPALKSGETQRRSSQVCVGCAEKATIQPSSHQSHLLCHLTEILLGVWTPTKM